MQGVPNAWYCTSSMIGSSITEQIVLGSRLAFCVPMRRSSPSLLLIPATCTLMEVLCKQVQETRTISSRTDRHPGRLLHRVPLDPRPDFRRQLDTMVARPAADNAPPFGNGGWGRWWEGGGKLVLVMIVLWALMAPCLYYIAEAAYPALEDR
jgi:hypothetical protein